MDILYYKKIQNAYGTNNRRERELAKVNRQMTRHFNDTFDTENVLINGIPKQLMIIKDTDGNTFKKKIKSVHDEKFNLGDYVVWNNQVWLVTLVDTDEKTWNRGYMYLCTIQLRWQNSSGKIIERWAYSEDFTKYSGGLSGNNVMTIGANQYGLTLPIDEETKKLKRDMRFAIDFDDAEEPEIYVLGNRKVKLNDNLYFGRGGTMIATFTFDFFNRDTDKRVSVDGKEFWICDYKDNLTLPPISNETTNLSATISGSSKINCGFSREYFAIFADEDGEEIHDVTFDWNIVADFDVKATGKNNVVELLVDDKKFIGNSFLLQIFLNGKSVAEKEITVIDKF